MKTAIWLAAALVLSSCAHAPRRDAETEIRAATQRYVQLSMAMDHAGIAAMFAPDGELDVPRRLPVHGPDAIRHYLEGFRNFHVISDELTTDRVAVHGDSADSSGTYSQRVRTPEGNVVDVHGHYAVQWVRRSGGAWLIRRMSTWS